VLTYNDIEQKIYVDEPIKGFEGHTYRRTKRWREFISLALDEIIKQYNIEVPDNDKTLEDFINETPIEDFFPYSVNAEIAYILLCREEAEDITCNLREIQRHTDGRMYLAIDLRDIEQRIIDELVRLCRKNIGVCVE